MKPRSYNNLWKGLHKSAREKRFPLRMMFELTYRCNFKCGHCYVPRSYGRKRELKTKEVFSVLDELKEMGCFYLGFTGGEPFIRKDIMDILWYAKRKGFEVIIYTNGSLIDENLAGELARLKPNKADITIPALGRHAFERISGVEGSRDRVFKAIGMLHKNRVNLGFKTCVLKENILEIKEIEDFACSLGAPYRLNDMIFPRLDGLEGPCHGPSTTNLFECGAGISQAAITPSGELKICLMIDQLRFRILDTSLKDAWEKMKESIVSINPKCPAMAKPKK